MKTCEGREPATGEPCGKPAVVNVRVFTRVIELSNVYCNECGQTIALASSASGYDVIVEPVEG